MTVTPLTTLKSHENKEDLTKWWGLVKCQLKNTRYKDIMFKTWLAKNADANRGFKEVKKGEETISAEEQSALVQDMLESITSYLPHIASSPIINNAVSLEWVFEYLKTHFGYERSAKDLMHKFITLERKPGEKMRAYWSRFEAFFEDNHIKKDDKLKVNDAKATESDKQCRYGIGSELVLFLHMAHKELPSKLASFLSTKLKHNDVASLKTSSWRRPKTSWKS